MIVYTIRVDELKQIIDGPRNHNRNEEIVSMVFRGHGYLATILPLEGHYVLIQVEERKLKICDIAGILTLTGKEIGILLRTATKTEVK